MTYKEPLETVILQKLEVMEDFLKSFMSSLEEPPQKKGRRVEVKAQRGGRIERWHKKSGQEVGQFEELCTINADPLDPDPEPWDTYTVRAPVEGILFIKVETGLVGAGETIAEIVQKTVI